MIVDDEMQGQPGIHRKLSGSQPIVPFGNCHNRLRTKATQGAPKLPCVGRSSKGEPTGNQAPEHGPPALRPESELPVSDSGQAPRRLRYGRPPLHDHQSLGGIVLKETIEQP